MRNNLRNWLALHRTPKIGSIKFKEFLLDDGTLGNLPDWIQPNWLAVAQDLAWQEKDNCHILTLQDKDYPVLLKKIHNPPPVLFVQGNLNVLHQQQIAIVGSRRPTHLGVEIAHNFAKYFATLGLTITSGLALGIDTASHQGAISSSAIGKTIAVMACGLDQIYPSANKSLAARIVAEGGALVSEFPIGVQPVPNNFPSRNRIISGLSLGVLVVEAAAASGALITAEIAADQGREVFAIPGSIYNAKSKGCHKLIKQGAKLVDSTDDVLEELSTLLNIPSTSTRNETCQTSTKTDTIIAKKTLYPEYIEVLSCIDFDPTPVDSIIMRSKRSAMAVNNMLVQLELEGHITSVPGGYIRY